MKRLFVLVALTASFACNADVALASASYAGQESREVKALSPEEIQAYLAGKGMGLAKAAELNGYPGPSHVLALSSQLNLTPEQLARTKALFTSMEAKAISSGAPLVEEERKLDRMFSNQSITPEMLSTTLAHIAELQAQVRAAHLEAHLTQARILTPEQIGLYMQLRGYASNGSTPKNEHHQHTGGSQETPLTQ